MPSRARIPGVHAPSLLQYTHPARRPTRVCLNCRPQWQLQRRQSSVTSEPRTGNTSTKPYYVTTPIFYVNAAPHVGHLYSMVLTDILKRWQQLRGRKALMLTGTDEHGMKIQQASVKAGSEPKAFCDRGAEVFRSLAARANISNDYFMRTTDQHHREAVEYAWLILRAKGYIYSSTHSGWYSVSDETFYPQNGVHLVIDPATGRKIMTSIETGKEVEWTSETNHHFRLSAFRDRLLDFYKENPSWIVPQTRMQNVVDWVSSGLNDLSVSRPTDRLTWGIRVPDDSTQTIYVWLDALLNYASKAGYPFTPGREQAGGWPADAHVIGKDIVRFHCIYWPAFLMALDLPLPKRILTHAHWTLGKAKMAKSTGNVVNPFFALDRFGVDPMRYYLAHDGGISDDADYANEHIVVRYKKDLQGGLGNLASRVLRGKGWSVPRAVKKMSKRPQHEFEEMLKGRLAEWHSDLLTVRDEASSHMDALDCSRSVKAIITIIYKANTYLHESAPWSLASSADPNPQDLERLDTIIYLAAETLRIAGILLQPWMPEKAAVLLDMLGVETGSRDFDHAQPHTDAGYGKPFVDLGKGEKGVLFPRLISED